MMVEGKVHESFGPVLKEWRSDVSLGKEERLRFVLRSLGLWREPDGGVRYQLLHRAASAIITAEQYRAVAAVLVVHSFSKKRTGCAEVQKTEHGYADEKVLALTLLARTISNVKGAILLLDAKRVVEARTITRSVFENLYWIVGLSEEGDAFVRKMRDDEMNRRRAQGQNIFAADLTLETEVGERLRDYLRRNKKQFEKAASLSPKQVAQIRRDFAKTYIFYGQLSSDSAHPSVTALNRYVVPESHPEGGGIDVEPLSSDHELAETCEYLCMAAIGVCVGANQIIGGTPGAAALNVIAERHVDLSNRTKAASDAIGQPSAAKRTK